jgi:hypothetical protein
MNAVSFLVTTFSPISPPRRDAAGEHDALTARAHHAVQPFLGILA